MPSIVFGRALTPLPVSVKITTSTVRMAHHRSQPWCPTRTERELAMEIDERTSGDVKILDLQGRLTLGDGDELLKDKINSLLLQGCRKLVLNLEGVPYIDSAGLGEIVRTYTTVSRQGGSLKLLNLTKRIEDLLSITKLLTVFETYDTEHEAVRSFPSVGD